MKNKKLAFLMLVIFAVSSVFAGCANKSLIEVLNDNKAGTVAQEQQTTFKAGETAVFENMKITATEIKESSGDGYFSPKEGNTFIGVNITIENTSAADINISSLMFFEAYADDVKYDYSLSAARSFDDGTTLDGTLSPGKKLVGWYTIEAPANWSAFELHFKNKPADDSAQYATFVFKK